MRMTTWSALAALAMAVGGCCSQSNNSKMTCCMDAATTAPAAVEHKHESMWAGVTHAVAVVYPTKGSAVSGTIWFDQLPEDAANKGMSKVHVHGTLTGLDPNSTHACHIHEF